MPTDTKSPTVVLPLDGSPLAERAIGLARTAAERLGARLLLVTVPELAGLDAAWYTEAAFESEAVPPSASEWLGEARAASRDYLAAQAAALEEAGLDVMTVVAEDLPHRAIVAAARDCSAPLIVMATHGWGGLSRWAFGSVADKVLHTADSPVLLVRSEAENLDPQLNAVLVALDGSPDAERVLDDVRALTAGSGASVMLVQVIQGPIVAAESANLVEAQAAFKRTVEERLAKLAAWLRDSGVAADYRILAGDDVAETLLDTVDHDGFDLIALTTHGRGGLERFFFGSVADRLIRHSSSPVLVRRLAEE